MYYDFFFFNPSFVCFCLVCMFSCSGHNHVPFIFFVVIAFVVAKFSLICVKRMEMITSDENAQLHNNK